jgi:hypothetical protein
VLSVVAVRATMESWASTAAENVGPVGW